MLLYLLVILQWNLW